MHNKRVQGERGRSVKRDNMNSRIFAILLAFIPASGQAIELDLELEALTPNIAIEEEPKFRLTVSNMADVAVSILKIDKQVAYYELVVDQSGSQIAVSQNISDPLTLNPDGSDYIDLKPGEVTGGMLSGYSEVLSELPCGDYNVHLRYTMSPLLDIDFKGASNKTRISIGPEQKRHRTNESGPSAPNRASSQNPGVR